MLTVAWFGLTAPADAALADETFDPTERIHGAVTVIGDSVLQASVVAEPTLPQWLGGHGWGPIRARAGVGYTTGFHSTSGEARATYWIEQWRREGWDAPNVLVNLGANDSGRCDRDLACARAAILHVVTAIGPGHRVWWPMITRHPAFAHQADTWNLALEQIAAERADFFTWDWPTVLAGTDWARADNTHLTADGYRGRSALLAREFTADLGAAVRVGGPAPRPTPVGGRTEMVPIGPTRALDTRLDRATPVPAETAIEIDVSDLVPPNATAVAAYVSATQTVDNGFLTAYDCGALPDVSAANHLAGETRGSVAVTPLSPTGTICLYTKSAAHLLVDVQAAFVPVADDTTDALRFDPLAVPERLVDTRNSGRAPILELDAPAGADAVSISVTAILSDEPGYVVAYPCDDEPPLVATVNHGPDEVISGAAFVPVSDEGTICIWSLAPVDITVDLTGVFAADGSLVFQAVQPTRMIDTRSAIGGWSPLHGRGQTIDAVVAAADAAAVTGTLTIVTPLRNGFLQASGCDGDVETANVTALRDTVLANSVTTGLAPDGALCVYARSATATLFDTTGWWIPAD